MTRATPRDWQKLWQTLSDTGVLGARPALDLGRLAATALRHGPTPYALVAWHAAQHPNTVAIDAPDGRLTYRELLAQADASAAQLVPLIGPKTRVGLLGRGGVRWVVGLLVATRLGAEVVLMNTLHSPEGWATQTRKMGLAAILHEATYAQGLRQHPHPAALVELGDGLLIAHSPKLIAPRFGSVTLLTSGSTGNPRTIRRRTGLSRSLAVCAATDFLTRLAPKVNERVWLPPPLFHGHGLSALMLTWGFGGTLILADGDDLWASLEAADPHWAVLVPTMLHRLLEQASDAPPNLRRVVCGSAPLSPRLAQQAQAVFGRVLFNLYGTTETGPIALATPADLAAGVNVGRVLDGVQVDLSAGTVNVRSPFLAVNAESWNTGDQAEFDAAGRLHLRGRADDRFICGGENVDPEELEHRIEQLAGVRECAVWGESDAEYGQVVHALIVPQLGADLADIQASLAQALPRTLRPRSVTLCAELPRNAAGKLARQAFQAMKN